MSLRGSISFTGYQMTRFLSIALLLFSLCPCSAATKTFPLLNSYVYKQPFILQSITTNAWAAYSMARRLSSTYTGPAFTVLRATDLVEQDIGFVNDLTDTNTLLTFTGSASGFVRRIYDQSGNGRHLSTNNNIGTSFTNAIPYVVITGTLQKDDEGRPVSYSNDARRDVKGVDTMSVMPYTYFVAFLPISHSARDVFVCTGGEQQGAIGQVSLGSFYLSNAGGGPENAVINGTYTLGIPYLATLYFATNSESLNINNGSATTSTSSSVNPSSLEIGDASSNLVADSKFSEWIVYNISLSAGDTLTLQNNINAFYTIWNTNNQSTLNNNLISYWKMDEASGNRADAKDGDTLNDNNTVTSNTGIISNAGQFTAANSETLSIADNAQLSTGNIDFQFIAWAYMDSKGGFRTILAKGSGAGNYEYALRFNNSSDRYGFVVSNDGTATVEVLANNFGSPPLSTWTFLSAYHDSVNNIISISVNDGTANTTAHTTGVFDSTAAFVMGSFASLAYWDGRVDEVGFWKRILTAGEVTELYKAGVGKTCCPFTP
jgi:hypothetical protein